MRLQKECLRRAGVLICRLAPLAIVPVATAMAANVEVFHADPLAGPMRELKKTFEAKNPGATLAELNL